MCIVLLFIFFILILFVIILNTIRTLSVKIEESKADLEVYLIKRYDILTESLKIAKKYMEHETDIMINITKIRKGMDLNETTKVLEEQESFMNKFYATAENYPDLYSNELFKNLQAQITDTNEHLSAAKRLYNSNVSVFNQYIVQFPVTLVAKIVNEKQREFLKDENIEEKKDFKLDL